MPGEGMLGAVFRHIGLAEDIPGNSLHALVGPGDPGDLAFHGLVSLPIVYLTGFLHANRYPPPDQVRGHASLENAMAHGRNATASRGCFPASPGLPRCTRNGPDHARSGRPIRADSLTPIAPTS